MAEPKSATRMPRTPRYLRKPRGGGGGSDAALAVEAADSEARRLRRHRTNPSDKLLALLRTHHDYGAGELMLRGGRQLSTGTITNG
jgi:hypothetical protein